MLPFWASDAVLLVVQAALVCGPRPQLPRALLRLRTGVWAWILPLSLGATIALLAVLPGAADAYTWLALVAIPLLTVAAVARGTGWVAAVVVTAALFVLAWAAPHHAAGQAAAVAMTALSCSTLASYLRPLAPRRALEAGIVAMAVLDAILVFGQLLQGPNDTLNAAAPAAGLPQLQFAHFQHALVGYGDFFVAAVLGTVLIQHGRHRLHGALLVLAFSVVFDLLFFVVDTLPATVPVAVALVVIEARARRGSRRGQPTVT